MRRRRNPRIKQSRALLDAGFRTVISFHIHLCFFSDGE
jgi:hypothetical protein